jgi:basic membrane lipoprotein Med (substrate-binding protein (PBP1-ABC) superfamily)
VRVPQWTDGITAGAGWIALAIVVFASWALARFAGCLSFRRITVLQLNLQAAGARIPVEYLSMSPYLITILVLVIMSSGVGRAGAGARAGTEFSRLTLRQQSNRGQRAHSRGVDNETQNTSGHGRLGPAAGFWRRRHAQGMDKAKACFVYVGPIGDGGWTFQHHEGALAVQAAFGDKVEIAWQENVPEGADAERVLTQMALSGCNIIFTTSFGYMDATNAVAAKFPDVKFEHATGYKREHPNVSTYNARFYEGRAVQGHIAGKMTKSNKIGYIGSFPIPEVIMGINSYFLHAAR